MKSIIETYQNYISRFDDLKKFIEYLERHRKYYNLNREILYAGVVSRCYSLWETFNKNIVFEYYQKIKEELITSGQLIQKLKLNELPAFIVEEGNYNRENNYVYYELKEEFITFTSKNMEINQMTTLFDRVNIKIKEKLVNNKNINSVIEENPSAFNIDLVDDNALKKSLKMIIDERNIISHYATIDEYKDLSYIKGWIKLYMTLLQEIIKSVGFELSIKDYFSQIGEFKNYLTQNNILCIDLYDKIQIKKSSLIGIVRNGSMTDIVIPLSFKIDEIEQQNASANDKVGIKLKSYFNHEVRISDTSKIFLLVE
jgi:hypothetical protein